MAKFLYEVIVQNVGKVWEGTSGFDAFREYSAWVGKSKRGEGRAAGEGVVLFKNNEIMKEHDKTEVD